MIFHVGSDNGCVITKMLEETLFRSCVEAQSPPRLIFIVDFIRINLRKIPTNEKRDCLTSFGQSLFIVLTG